MEVFIKLLHSIIKSFQSIARIRYINRDYNKILELSSDNPALLVMLMDADIIFNF